MVMWPMTSRDLERSSSWPNYILVAMKNLSWFSVLIAKIVSVNGRIFIDDALYQKVLILVRVCCTYLKISQVSGFLRHGVCLTGERCSWLRCEADLLCRVFGFDHSARYCTVSLHLLQVSYTDNETIYLFFLLSVQCNTLLGTEYKITLRRVSVCECVCVCVCARAREFGAQYLEKGWR